MESSLQTKAVVTFCAASCVAQFAMAARWVFTSPSFSNSSMWWLKRWGTCFPKCMRHSRKSKTQSAARKKHLTKRWTEESNSSSARSRAFWGARAPRPQCHAPRGTLLRLQELPARLTTNVVSRTSSGRGRNTWLPLVRGSIGNFLRLNATSRSKQFCMTRARNTSSMPRA